MEKIKAIIMGAAGRDFHNFNVCFQNNPRYKIVAFTASQIPDIAGRKYKGIDIFPEEEIHPLIKKSGAKEVFFSYSDVSYIELMQKAAEVLSAGAGFNLLGPDKTMLKSKKPVIAVTAVRTGCGKSIISQKIADFFSKRGLRVGIVRHPMPYGDLRKQVCQRFSKLTDLDRHNCTIEEREEYEPYLEKGLTIYAGVDYQKILNRVEKESDLILWDGGNNDTPFYKPDLWITVADAYRPGHETRYYPGEINFKNADIIVITKIDKNSRKNLDIILKNAKKLNPKAKIIKMKSVYKIDHPALVKGKNVLAVEDGPSITHGGLPYGAAFKSAKKYGARRIVDPRPYAVGSLVRVFEKYGHLGTVLPAMGYGKKQMRELEKTVNETDCYSVVLSTPAKIEKFMNINKPVARTSFEFKELGRPILEDYLAKLTKDCG